jgi:hypothetical protein
MEVRQVKQVLPGVGTSERGEDIKKGYENGKMRPVETIPEMGEGG